MQQEVGDSVVRYPVYSDAVKQYFEHPGNAGKLGSGPGSVATGVAGEKRTGVRVQFDIRVDGDCIVDARFRAYGCPHTIAAASWLARSISGKKISTLQRIDPIKVADELELPREKLGCVLVAEDALNACVADFHRSTGETG